MNRIVSTLFCGLLVWEVFRGGFLEAHASYQLFLLLVLALLVSLIWRSQIWIKELRFLPLHFVGFFLVIQVCFLPTTESWGFVVVAIGWLALYLTMTFTVGQLSAARLFLLFLIFVGGAEALFGLTQALVTGSRVTGTFIYPNHFAGLLNMTIPLAIGGLLANHLGSKKNLESEANARTWIVLLSCAFMALGIFLSLSRAGSLIFLFTAIFLATLLSVKRKWKQRRRLSGKAVWILIFVALGLGSGVGVDALLARFPVGDPNRTVAYLDTVEMISDYPLFGIGPGMYQWRIRPYQTFDASIRFFHAHNDYLQSAAEWGIPLAVLFWGFVGWRFWRSVRVFYRSKDPWKQGIGLGCAGAIFSILVHSFVDFNLQLPANLMVFCVILGLAWSVDTQPANQVK